MYVREKLLNAKNASVHQNKELRNDQLNHFDEVTLSLNEVLRMKLMRVKMGNMMHIINTLIMCLSPDDAYVLGEFYSALIAKEGRMTVVRDV